MFRIIQPNTWYADPHGAPCKILRATHEVIHYIRNGRTCIASMGRFNQDFEPLTKAQAERIAEEIETAEHIEKLRSNVWANAYFLVQEFKEDGGVIRLTVNTTSIGGSGRWKDGISWDALQEIKSAVGYGDRDAVEIYPRDADVVNVANMRHLWITPEPISFAWRK